MIGLIDCEVLDKNREFLPNQEIMKLYTYFRRNNQVKLLQDDSLIAACSTIYVRKNTKESPIPSSWQTNKQVLWGGAAFTKGKYVPMTSDMENSMPNYHVYNEYLKSKKINIFDETKKEARYFDYSFVRLDNGELIQPRHIRMDMPLLIYSTDTIFPNDYAANFQRIHQMSPKPIEFLNSIEIENLEQIGAFCKNDLSNFKMASGNLIRTSQIYFTGAFNHLMFKKMIIENANYLSKFQSNTLFLPTFSLKAGTLDIFSKNALLNLEKLMNFIYQAMSYNIFFTIYETKNVDGEINIIYQKFIDYINNRRFNYYPSFLKYIARRKNFGKSGRKELLDILSHYPVLKYLYDIDCFNLSRGGIWYGQFKH